MTPTLAEQQTQLEVRIGGDGPLGDEDYEAILRVAAPSVRLTMGELERLRRSKVARLLAAVPYRAGCENPDLIAVLHVSMYVAGMRSREFFAHRDNQSLGDRIGMGLHYPDGDAEVIDAAMAILESVSLNDHKKDADADRRRGYPNPLNMGLVDYATEKRRIRERLRAVRPALRRELEGILSSSEDHWSDD